MAELEGIEVNEITERDVISAMKQFDPVWDELFPDEQMRSVQLLIKRVAAVSRMRPPRGQRWPPHHAPVCLVPGGGGL